MRRLLAAGISLALLLLLTSPTHAQLGGLKKKVAEKVTGKKPDTTVVAGGTGKPKCDKSSMVITGDVVDRYLKALAARDAEIKKMAREPGPVGEYYAAYFRRQAVEHRKTEYDMRRGPDWERYKGLYLKMVKGDQEALKASQALSDSLDPNKVQLPEYTWESQQKGNARLDSVMMATSGISYCDWSGNGIGDRLPALVGVLANDPDTRDLRGYGTPQEAAAIKPRMRELTTAMGYRARDISMTDAEKAHIKEEDEKLIRQSMLTGDPYTDCATKVQQDFTKQHQAEFEKANKDRDMAASTRLSMLLLQETDRQCKKFSKDKDSDDE